MLTETLPLSEARKQFTNIDKMLADTPLIWVTRHNRRAFAIVKSDLFEALNGMMECMKDPGSCKALANALAAALKEPAK